MQHKFHPMRVTEEKMTDDEVLHTVNTAFGGWVVERIETKGKTRIIHFDDTVYDAPECYFDEFFADMAVLGRVYICNINDGRDKEDGYEMEIVYSEEKLPNTWELRYLKSRPLKIRVWSDEERDFVLVNPNNKKNRPPPVRRESRRIRGLGPAPYVHPKPAPVPPPVETETKKCICPCTCGARIGTSF
jgi:hypothetical protein